MTDQQARIRPLAAGDIDVVADLFASVMLASKEPASAALRDFMRDHFLKAPFVSADCPSLVFEQEGMIDGFIGVTEQHLKTADRLQKAAVTCALMVRDHAKNPLAGARLLRSVLSGPQDITITETAGDETLGMLRSQGSIALPQHSMTWIRVLQPAQFFVDQSERRLSLFSATRPLARVVDRARRNAPSKTAAPKWSRWHPTAPQKGVGLHPIDGGTFFDLASELSLSFDTRPEWPDAVRAAMLDEMQSKKHYGTLKLAKVAPASGRALAVVAYYLTPHRTAHVLQILARPGQEGIAVDALLAEAYEHDAIALQGRTDPRLMNALLGRRVFMVNESSSVVHGRDTELIEKFVSGRAMMNGLVGERWSRLLGDRF